MLSFIVNGFQQRLSGRRQRVADWLANAILGEISFHMMMLITMAQAVKIYGRIAHHQWVALIPTTMDCMIWPAMFGNGAPIGMVVVTTPIRRGIIRRGPVVVPGEFCAAVRGTTTVRPTCAAPVAPTTVRLSRATLVDFVAPNRYPFSGDDAASSRRRGQGRMLRELQTCSWLEYQPKITDLVGSW